MKNTYEHLRTDTRDLLPGWIDYPMAEQCETVEVYRDGYYFIGVDIGEQEGYYVAGITYYLDKGGKTFGAGRKWGQFSARKDAMLWALGEILADEERVAGAARKAVKAQLFNELQPTLF